MFRRLKRSVSYVERTPLALIDIVEVTGFLHGELLCMFFFSFLNCLFFIAELFPHSESEDHSKVWYYSSPGQLQLLTSGLDGDFWERDLMYSFTALNQEIIRQMEKTLSLTDEARDDPDWKSVLEVESGGWLCCSLAVICTYLLYFVCQLYRQLLLRNKLLKHHQLLHHQTRVNRLVYSIDTKK